MPTRGIRGATTISKDNETEVLQATVEMLKKIISANPNLRAKDIASALFTVTGDIRSTFPARAAQSIGWENVPRTCAKEIPVDGSLPLCIRVLIHWNTNLEQNEIKHLYLRGARVLRPDLTQEEKSK